MPRSKVWESICQRLLSSKEEKNMQNNAIEVKGLQKSYKKIPNSTWTGMVPVDDTALAVTNSGGTGIPVVYLNGSYADQSHWRKVTADLGPGWRHITYDERARGRSRKSTDYSFEACVRDVDAVLKARAWTGRSLSAGPTARISPCTVPVGTRTGFWAWSRLTARTRSPGSTTPPASGSGSCSTGWAGCSP